MATSRKTKTSAAVTGGVYPPVRWRCAAMWARGSEARSAVEQRAVPGTRHRGGVPAVLGDQRRLGAVVEQHLHKRGIVGVGGRLQRREAALLADVGRGAGLQQRPGG